MELAPPALKAFLCGSLSGTCSTLMFQPLDLVKTRLQTLHRHTHPGSARVGMVTVLQSVVRTERLQGLWRGVSPSFARTIPGVGIYFSTFHSLKQRLLSGRSPGPLEALMLGGGARAVAGVVVLPVTVIKTRFECGRFGYSSVCGALLSVCRTEGPSSLFSGLGATLLRDVPFSAIYFLFYSQTQDKLPAELRSCAPAAALSLGCGVAAGVMASVVTQPADVVKTHLQVDPRLRTLDAVRVIFTDQGVRGFFRGAVPRSLRRTMMAAMAWTVYERMMSHVGLKS